MIRTLTRPSGMVVSEVIWRAEPGERTSRVFRDPGEAWAFDQIVSARWSADPLIVACGYNPDNEDDLERWAHSYRVDGNTLRAARSNGLTDAQADQLATAAGLHPVDVWGWAWCEIALTPPDPEPLGAVA